MVGVTYYTDFICIVISVGVRWTGDGAYGIHGGYEQSLI